MSAVLTARRKRLLLLLGTGALLVAAGAFFIFPVFSDNIAFYVTPGGIAAGEARGRETLRVGGLVQPGSLQRGADGVRFTLIDGNGSLPVVYNKVVLPDLFAEGKGAIAQGKLDAAGVLLATEVLAKHDENYMPPKVQASLDKNHPASAAAAAASGAAR